MVQSSTNLSCEINLTKPGSPDGSNSILGMSRRCGSWNAVCKKMCTFATKKTTHPGVGVWPSIKTENPFVVEIELQHFRF